MRLILLVVLTTTAMFSQSASIGVKVGVPLGNAFDPSAVDGLTSNARRYLIGGTVELHLPLRVSLELDAIYKRTGYSTFFQSTDIGRFSSNTAANQWEFPLLAKYEILSGPIRPFVDAGPVLRHLSGLAESSTYLTYFPVPGTSGSTTTNNPPDLRHRNTPGVVFGAGVTFKFLHLRISPEARYTHWLTNTFETVNQPPAAISNPNQADLLVGITF